MGFMLARSGNAIVTAGTYPGDIGMVVTAIRFQFQKMNRIVADIAFLGSYYVPTGHAYCNFSIVAATAVAQDLGVVDLKGRCERHDSMAVLTDVGSSYMRRWFANHIHRVVTTHAVSNDVVVVEIRRQPAIAGMAVVAGLTAQDMTGVLTGGRHAVVATTAVSLHLQVVDPLDGRERYNEVTVFADIGRLDMRQRLTDFIDGVMAADAVPREIVVIEIGGDPSGRCVAVIAGLATRNMPGILAVGRRAVMAA